MAIRARIDRHKCVGAGNCITLAPTAFDWLAGDYGKSDVVGADSIDEELLRAAAFACPTAAVDSRTGRWSWKARKADVRA